MQNKKKSNFCHPGILLCTCVLGASRNVLEMLDLVSPGPAKLSLFFVCVISLSSIKFS